MIVSRPNLLIIHSLLAGEDFLKEERYLSAREKAARRNRRNKVRSASVEPETGGDERRLADSSERCHLLFFLSLFSLSLSSPFFLVHPRHFIVPVGGGRPSLIESAVLYLLGPPQLFVCFSPILVLFSSLSLSSVLPSPLINGILSSNVQFFRS